MRKLLILVLILALGGAAAALVITNRPKLDDSRQAVDTAWQPLVVPLAARYAALATLQTRLTATLGAIGQDNPDVDALGRALARWNRAVAAKDPEAQVKAANDLEARAGALRALLAASARLIRTALVAQALAAFDQAAPPAEPVAAYNDAVRKYQRAREGTVRPFIAQIFGYDERPSYEPSLPPAA